jgi:hypothetical protein
MLEDRLVGAAKRLRAQANTCPGAAGEKLLRMARQAEDGAQRRMAAVKLQTGPLMQDYPPQNQKLRMDAAECAIIRDFASDPAKRDLFDRFAQHLNVLAKQVQMAIGSSADVSSNQSKATMISGQQPPKFSRQRNRRIAAVSTLMRKTNSVSSYTASSQLSPGFRHPSMSRTNLNASCHAA